MKYEEDSDAMFVAVEPVGNTGVALDDEAIVGESAEIVEAVKVGQHLRTYSPREILVAWLEYGPTHCTRYRVDDLQAQTANR